MGTLRTSIDALTSRIRTDADDAALAEFITDKLKEFDAAQAAIKENQRVEALINPPTATENEG